MNLSARANRRRAEVLILAGLCAAAAAIALGLAGCGNVYLRGEALTAAQASALDAYTAAERLDANAAPAWCGAYLAENFRQWRWFVRSAIADPNWGPRLKQEQGP
jgi:hypothetical protein